MVLGIIVSIELAVDSAHNQSARFPSLNRCQPRSAKAHATFEGEIRGQWGQESGSETQMDRSSIVNADIFRSISESAAKTKRNSTSVDRNMADNRRQSKHYS
jgi:hypothetical protein